MDLLHTSNIKIILRKPNTHEDYLEDDGAVGIMDLTYRPHDPASDPWRAFTGDDAGLGGETTGTWSFPPTDVGRGNTRHYFIYNSKGQFLLTLFSVPNPRFVAAGATGTGVLHRDTGGTLAPGVIEWKVIGKV